MGDLGSLRRALEEVPDRRDHEAADPVKFLTEESSIQWKRDWDAVLIGFVLGVLATLAVGGL
jgi:hypothetical protein